jgi:hypothetical protein
MRAAEDRNVEATRYGSINRTEAVWRAGAPALASSARANGAAQRACAESETQQR